MQVSLGSHLCSWQVAIINGYRGCPVVCVHQTAILGVHGKQRPPLVEKAGLAAAHHHHIEK
jgi:hypothetical protein